MGILKLLNIKYLDKTKGCLKHKINHILNRCKYNQSIYDVIRATKYNDTHP